MSELPDGWLADTLGNLSEKITKGTTPTTMGYDFQTKGIAFIKIENISENGINTISKVNYISNEAHQALFRSQLVEGDILFTIAGTIGKTALVSKSHLPANTNQAVAIIRGTQNSFQSRFLLYQLKWRAVEIKKTNARGGAMNNVSLGDISNSFVMIPPLSEQKRIADKLDTLLARLDTTRERLDRIPATLKQFRQAVLSAATSGALTEEWRENNGTRLESWSNVIAKDVCIKITDGEHQTPKRQPNGKMLLSAKNIRDGYIDYNDFDLISDNDFNKSIKRCMAEINDVLIVSVGATVGRTAIKRENIDFALVRSVGLFKIDGQKIIGDFLLHALRSPITQRFIGDVSRGNAQPTLYLEPMSSIPIFLPPLFEQKEIVRRVEKLFAFADKIEARYQTARAQVDKLTPALLAKAFRGELVEQDPNDEPAEILLERIRAKRKDIIPVKKSTTKKTAKRT